MITFLLGMLFGAGVTLAVGRRRRAIDDARNQRWVRHING